MANVGLYVCCSNCVGVCGNVCSVADVVKDSDFLALECWSMLYVCVRDVMDVFLFVLWGVKQQELVYGKCECFVMQMLYVCVLCASCVGSQCCVLHDSQFLNAV